ncbi:hypothetical protein NPIL_69271 [Nephila pilipes]|uniref:Uncharacterized protein n=1 Tax=Nephila pilipes TaxID=299642 RepID=A0A8X6UHF0_NEPPI|nr:hypothetical protein NPIL_69271 [Nephila pilipes]
MPLPCIKRVGGKPDGGEPHYGRSLPEAIFCPPLIRCSMPQSHRNNLCSREFNGTEQMKLNCFYRCLSVVKEHVDSEVKYTIKIQKGRRKDTCLKKSQVSNAQMTHLCTYKEFLADENSIRAVSHRSLD